MVYQQHEQSYRRPTGNIRRANPQHRARSIRHQGLRRDRRCGRFAKLRASRSRRCITSLEARTACCRRWSTPDFSSTARSSNAAMDTPGSFEDRVKVLARAVFESASSKPLFWRFIHSVIWAPPGTALPQTESCTQFYDGVVGVLAAAAEKAVSAWGDCAGSDRRADADSDGCDQRGRDRLRDCRQARIDARARGRNRRNNFQRMAMTRTAL